MSEGLVQRIADRFRAYAEPFLDEPGDLFAYRLKIDHTRRVQGFASDIASASGLPERLRLAANIAALLHDVGRFPQYKLFRTFRDAESANHASLSVRHALREGMLEGVPTDIRRIVLGAVFLHNMRALPTSLPPDTLAVARVLRDADKLDIYSVMIAHFSQENPEHPEVALDVQNHPTAYSANVLRDLKSGVTGDYRSIVFVNDFKLMTIGWLYDINYRHSCQMLKDFGHLETLFGLLPEDPPITGYRAQIMNHLAQRLAHDGQHPEAALGA